MCGKYSPQQDICIGYSQGSAVPVCGRSRGSTCRLWPNLKSSRGKFQYRATAGCNRVNTNHGCAQPDSGDLIVCDVFKITGKQ